MFLFDFFPIQFISLDDIVGSAAETPPQVYLPINVAKSAEVKAKEQQGEGQPTTVYANNVFVPISLERSTEVMRDSEENPGQVQG